MQTYPTLSTIASGCDATQLHPLPELHITGPLLRPTAAVPAPAPIQDQDQDEDPQSLRSWIGVGRSKITPISIFILRLSA